jgi:hypothetical protein
MTRFIRPLVAVVFLAACGHGSNSGAAGSIEGTVATSSGQALTVSAPASGKSTTTDATGAFFLTDVPAGTSELHLRGGANDASLHIQALGSGEHRSMSITVSGHTAQEDESHTSSAFAGEVTAVNPPNLTVAGRLVHTDANTKIRRGDATIAVGDIKVGEKAAVEGALQTDGSVLATRIEVGVEGEEPPSFAVFEGVLNKIDGTHLTVGILPVLLQPQTAIFKGETQVDASALQVGQNLLVMGIVDANQGILAARIRILVPDNGDDGEEAHLQGKVTAVAAHSLTVNDKVIAVDASTEFGGAGDPKSLADLHVGDVVEVDVVTAADGSLLAKEIERLPAAPPPPFIEAEGAVEAIGTDSITVAGAHFAVDSHTVIIIGDHAGALSDLKVGQTVEVKAMPRPDLPPLAIGIHAEL